MVHTEVVLVQEQGAIRSGSRCAGVEEAGAEEEDGADAEGQWRRETLRPREKP